MTDTMNKTIFRLISGLIILAVVAGFLFTLWKGKRAGSLTIKMGDNQVTINLSGEILPMENIFQNLFKDKTETETRQLVALLRKSANLPFYSVEDIELVKAIGKLDFKHPVSKGLRDLVVRGEGPFDVGATQVTLRSGLKNLSGKVEWG